jgi:hypothetical protein
MADWELRGVKKPAVFFAFPGVCNGEWLVPVGDDAIRGLQRVAKFDDKVPP